MKMNPEFAQPSASCGRCGAPLPATVPGSACWRCMLAVGETAFVDEFVSLPPGPDAAESRPAIHFGDYLLEQELDHGGMGVVYRAHQISLDRPVAVKLLLLGRYSSAESIHRFRREAQAAASLRHPNIVAIYEVGEHDGQHFFSMELVDGVSLAQVLDGSPLPPRRAAGFVLAIAHAIQFAHEHGVLHRDLKPSNILIDCGDEVKVADFGLAKRLGDESGLTQSGRILGTPNYLSPEAIAGAVSEVGPSSDIYGIGAIFYELLTGHPPFAGDTINDTLRRIRDSEPASPRAWDSSIPRDFETICLMCLEKDPRGRYASAAALAVDIQAALDGRPVKARRPGPLLILQRWAQRHALPVLLASVVLVVAAIAFAVVQASRSERDFARQLAAVNAALGDAELATRNGKWRDALSHWNQAQAAGYRDEIHLGLRRAVAWTVLSQPDRAGAELKRLAERSDLADRRGTVLLRLGEHELFDSSTYDQGVGHIEQAIETGLAGADAVFARGLLARSTPESLNLFREALQLNPFDHGAHRHSLGLEHLLGRHEELAQHLRVFKALFPDDPSAIFIEASELALKGELAEAQAQLQSAAAAVPVDVLKRLQSGVRLLALASSYYDIEVQLGERRLDRAELDQLLIEAASLTGASRLPGAPFSLSNFRVPALPCLQRGVHEAFEAVQTLMLPLWNDLDATIAKIKSSWEHHPEALLPMFAGTSLDGRHPGEGPRSRALLSFQTELFQMAANSPSVLPNLRRVAICRAAQAAFELAGRRDSGGAQARETCLEMIRNAFASAELSPAEGRAYFQMAFPLGDFGLAHKALQRWERLRPEDTDALRARIQLEVATGAINHAVESVDRLLSRHPEDLWARQQREALLNTLTELLNSNRTAAESNQ